MNTKALVKTNDLAGEVAIMARPHPGQVSAYRERFRWESNRRMSQGEELHRRDRRQQADAARDSAVARV
ncbi:MAG: hypothetical protein U0903_01130 [Planctomycetales bacterium]